MIKLYSPEDEIQLVILKSIFEAEGIPIFVHNDNFGSMKTGIQIALFNKKTIMVHEQHYEKGQEVIQHFLKNIENNEVENELETSSYTLFDKIRIVIEALLFGWVMPSAKKKKKPPNPYQAPGGQE